MNSAPATATDAAWIGRLLQLTDSFYPTGSYAHSFGLEGLTQEGVVRDRDTLRTFLVHSVLPTLRRVELPIAAHAWRALAVHDWKRVEELCHLSAALKTAAEARRASENIGRQRVELAATLRKDALATDYLERAVAGAWPFSAAISAAVEARCIEAPLNAVLAAVYYSNVASLLAAAMKLLRLGQNGCQTLLSEAMARSAEEIQAAVAIPYEEIGWFNPWLDIAAARHETAEARLFIS
jgi:urease accessory protein